MNKTSKPYCSRRERIPKRLEFYFKESIQIIWPWMLFGPFWMNTTSYLLSGMTSCFPFCGWSHLFSPNKRTSSFSPSSKIPLLWIREWSNPNPVLMSANHSPSPFFLTWQQVPAALANNYHSVTVKNGFLSWREQPSLGWWGPAMGSNYRKMPADRLIPWKVRLSWSSGTL